MYLSADNTFSSYITLPDFKFGESYNWERGQGGQDTAGGYMAVTDRGYTNRIISGLIPEVTHDAMWDAKVFFNETLLESMGTFYVSILNRRKSATWNKKEFFINCGALIGSAYIQCGQLYESNYINCGQRIATDYETLGPCRLRQDGFRSISRFDGIYDISLTFWIEHEG